MAESLGDIFSTAQKNQFKRDVTAQNGPGPSISIMQDPGFAGMNLPKVNLPSLAPPASGPRPGPPPLPGPPPRMGRNPNPPPPAAPAPLTGGVPQGLQVPPEMFPSATNQGPSQMSQPPGMPGAPQGPPMPGAPAMPAGLPGMAGGGPEPPSPGGALGADPTSMMGGDPDPRRQKEMLDEIDQEVQLHIDEARQAFADVHGRMPPTFDEYQRALAQVLTDTMDTGPQLPPQPAPLPAPTDPLPLKAAKMRARLRSVASGASESDLLNQEQLRLIQQRRAAPGG